MPGSYYSVDLSSTWRLVVLDTTEMSLHSGYTEVSSNRQSIFFVSVCSAAP
jgi:hypothetical protein